MSAIFCCRECEVELTYDEAYQVKHVGFVCRSCFINEHIPFDCYQCVVEVREQCASS